MSKPSSLAVNKLAVNNHATNNSVSEKDDSETSTADLTTAAADFVHETVLLYETVAAVLGVKGLDKKALDKLERHSCDGVYVDATYGRGGHSKLLLQYLSDSARLVVFDKDPTAIADAQALAAADARVTVVHDSFATLQDSLQQLGITQVDGVLADLGVSSPQLDDGSRGFSFMRDGAVDMRMDTSRGEPVSAWLNRVDAETLADVLYEYGEERYSRRIARAIKEMAEYDSTLALAETIKVAHPNWQKGKHPATQSFQALRIFINNELGDVDDFLEQTLAVLAPKGRLAVISFHSLEDRRIKQFLQRHSKGQYPEDEHLPMPPPRPKYFAKPKRIAPSKEEVAGNPRSRSAWLRVAQRTDVGLSQSSN